jgi:hypothetical protein
VSSYAAYAALQTGSVTTSWPTGAASPHTPPQAQLHGQCLIGLLLPTDSALFCALFFIIPCQLPVPVAV